MYIPPKYALMIARGVQQASMARLRPRALSFVCGQARNRPELQLLVVCLS
jgi:hypothetical protein